MHEDKPREIDAKEARDALSDYLRQDADLDLVARLFSEYMASDAIVVKDGDEKSDVYDNGDSKGQLVELTAEQVQKYLDKGGSFCPCCGSDDIEGDGSIESDANICWGPVKCNACGAEWEDQYKLTHVELLKEAPSVRSK